MRLEKLADLHIGLPIRRWETSGGTEYRMLSAKQITPYGDITGSEPFSASGPISNTFFTRLGDVIIKVAAPNPALCIAREEDCGLLVSSYFAIIRCREPGLCIPEYLNAYLNSPAFAEAAGRFRICSTVQSLKLSTLRELEIPLPNPERQRSIAEFFALSNVEQKQLQSLLAAKRQYHQSILARQFGGSHGE